MLVVRAVLATVGRSLNLPTALWKTQIRSCYFWNLMRLDDRGESVFLCSNNEILSWYTYCMEQSPSCEANRCLQLVKKFPAFYGTRRFNTAFTSARQLSISWARSIQSMPPHITFCRTILILSFHLRLGLPSGLFPSGFPTKTLCTPRFSPIRSTCPAHLILLDFITRTILGEKYRSLGFTWYRGIRYINVFLYI